MGRPRPAGFARQLAWLVLLCLACASSEARPPSIVLIVVDTLRADAVSAYGAVEGTTPRIDALASEGVRYTNAFAPSPWTLPSHATLLTGLAPEVHGVGIGGRISLPDDVSTLAGRLKDLGYDTLGISENDVISRFTGFDLGFDHFRSKLYVAQLQAKGVAQDDFDLVRSVRGWADARASDAPFFLFVNLFGVHDPYEYHPEHDFLPEGVGPAEARSLDTGHEGVNVAEALGVCRHLPDARTLEIVRGLYRGGVAAVDAQIRDLLVALEPARNGEPLITVVTSDHGELLGEHRMLGHQFSLHAPVLRIPLVVHGAPGSAPGVVDSPVGLGDLHDAVLAWAGAPEGVGLPGPGSPGREGSPRPLRAFWSDLKVAEAGPAKLRNEELERRRRGCTPEDRVFGDMVSVLEGPWKLIWYEDASPQLFDTSWDDQERSDVAAHHPDVVARLEDRIEGLRQRLTEVSPDVRQDERVLEALRELGYVE